MCDNAPVRHIVSVLEPGPAKVRLEIETAVRGVGAKADPPESAIA